MKEANLEAKMFKCTLCMGVFTEDRKNAVWFERRITLPFVPMPGISIDSAIIGSVDWSTESQSFECACDTGLAIEDTDDVETLAASVASGEWGRGWEEVNRVTPADYDRISAETRRILAND